MMTCTFIDITACLDDYVVCKCIACILAFNGNSLINYESADLRLSIPELYVYITRVLPWVNVQFVRMRLRRMYKLIRTGRPGV